MTLTVVLVLAALYLLAGKELHAKAAALLAGFRRPEVSWQQAAAAGLLILAVVAFNWQTPVTPSPTPPVPVPVGPLDLRGLFQARPVPRMPPWSLRSRASSPMSFSGIGRKRNRT
jgi:hypothetical protein